MRKFFIILTLGWICVPLMAQNYTDSVLTTFYNWSCFSDESDEEPVQLLPWAFTVDTVKEYDEKGNLLSRKLYSMNATEDFMQRDDVLRCEEVWSYDNDNNVLSYYCRNYNTSYGFYKIGSDMKYECTYENGKLATKLNYAYSATDDNWKLNGMTIYNYSNDLLESILLKDPDGSGGWIQSSQTFYTYDNDLLSQEEKKDYNSSTSSWENIKKVIYTYYQNGLLQSSEHYNWQKTSTNGYYDFSYRMAYEYDNNGQVIKETRSEYRNSILTEHQHRIYTYRPNGQILKYAIRQLNYNTNTWETVDSIDYVYNNADDRLYATIDYNFDRTTNCFELYSISYSYYHDTKAPYYFLWIFPDVDINTYEPLGEFSPDEGVYAYNTSLTVEAIPNDGYQFDGWSDGVKDNPRTFLMNRNYCLFAYFVTQTTDLEETKTQIDKPLYDVLGRPAGKDYHGIVIQNGKKYLR